MDQNEHVVIGYDRFIFVPDSCRKIGVQYDHNIEIVTFDCPRYWDGHDLSTMNIYINYARSDGVLGNCLCTNVVIDSSDSGIMHFDWTVSGNVTYVKGDISFLACAKAVDSAGNEAMIWNSELNSDMYVSEGLKCQDVILRQYPDIITQLLLEMKNTKGIDSIERTSGNGSAGSFDTYTIIYTNGTTSEFQIWNGADGDGAGDMLASRYDPQGIGSDIFQYVDDHNGLYVATTEGDGIAYTATVPAITELTAGASFIMITHTVSTSTTPTLNVNGLGHVAIRRRINTLGSQVAGGYANAWLTADRAYHMVYDGKYWIVENMTQAAAADLYGTVPIEKGGTDATTAAEARTNLDVFSKEEVALAISAEIEKVNGNSTETAASVQANLEEHISDAEVHVTDAERSSWNAKQNKLVFDTAPTSDSSNSLTSGAIYDALNAKQNLLVFDYEPTSGSPNSITSGAVYEALSNIQGTGGSGTGDADAVQANLDEHIDDTEVHITSAERAKWNAKQNTLTFDTTPISGSSNPITSGGVYAALQNVNTGGSGDDSGDSGDSGSSTSNASAMIVTKVSSSMTLNTANVGTHLYCTNTSDIVITIPAGLGAGFNCTIERWGVGGVSVIGDGVTINGGSNMLVLGDQFGSSIGVIALTDTIYSAKGVFETYAVTDSTVIPEDSDLISGSPLAINIVNVPASLVLEPEHAGCHLYCTNESDITILIPTGLGAGFNCTIERWGAGNVCITGNEVTVNGTFDEMSLGDQYESAVSVIALTDVTYSVKGITYITEEEPIIPVALPTLSSAYYYYTGNTIVPQWENYDSTQIGMGGDVSMIEIGSYITSFTPLEGYCWDDTGTNEARYITWEIREVIELIKVTLPNIVISTYYYTGNTVTPEWENYDSTQLKMGETISAIEVNSYATSFTPLEGYCWDDTGGVETKYVVWDILAAPSVDLPTLASSTYYYTGGTITPEWEGYDSSQVKMDGAIDGMSVGTYATSFTPFDGCVWSDTGTSATRYVIWEIKKLALEDMTLGDSVYLNVGGISTEFLIVHQGNPDPYIYDSSCTGTWLLMKDVYIEEKEWDTDNYNDYSGATIHSYLKSTFLKLLDADIQETIQLAKIPYWNGTGYYGDVATGSNGLSTKIFLLCMEEVGLSGTSYCGIGAKLDYFTTSDKTKRIAYYKGTAVDWGLRTPSLSSDSIAYVNASGSIANWHAEYTTGVRPALIIPSTWVGGDGAIDTNIVTVPTLSTYSFNYTENAVTPEWDNYNSTRLTIGGTTSATEIGSYATSFTPRDNRTWSDTGTNETRYVTWEIKEFTQIPLPILIETSYECTEDVITPIWEGYDSSMMTMSGDISATWLGTYTTRFTPLEGYCWEDGTIDTKSMSWKINTANTIESVTLAVASYPDYTGDTFTIDNIFTISNVDAFLIVGAREATDAGEYYTYFTPVSGHCWSDGYTGRRGFYWRIRKVDCTLSVSVESITLSGEDDSAIVTVTRPGDGMLHAEVDSQYCTVSPTSSNSLDSATFVVTGGETAGENIQIRFWCEEGTNHYAPESDVYCYVTNVVD